MLRLALLSLVWLGCAVPGDDGKAPAAPSAPAGLTAAEILDKAVERQGSRKLPDVIEDCHSALSATITSEDKAQLQAEIDEVYQRSGDRLRTTYTDSQSKKTTIRAYDGKRYRTKQGDEAALDITQGRDFDKDRKEIQDDRETIKLVLDLIALRATTGASAGAWTRLADAAVAGQPSLVLERRDGARPVRLYVSPSDFRVLAVELPPTEKDKRNQQFRLFETDRGQRAVLETVTVGGKEVSGLRLPRVVKLYVDGQGDPPTTDVWIKTIDINSGVSADAFSLK
jgi:hypothetical protein